jgi:DNA-directed RNA polymerase specialized sigma24 family protein
VATTSPSAQDELSLALVSAVRAVRSLRKPDRRTARATAMLELLGSAELELSRMRDEAVVAMHEQGSSCRDIAEAVGLTRGRVGQILQRARVADRAH